MRDRDWVALKAQAVELRKAGWSYSMISEELGLNKSTLSGWFKGEPHRSPIIAQREHLARVKAGKSKIMHHQRRNSELHEVAKTEIRHLFADGMTERELFLTGLMLYWAEGSKTQSVSMTNSDPYIIKTFIRWLEQCLHISRTQLRGEVHLYPDVNVDEAEAYWAELTQVPRSQFYKSQVDTRIDKSVAKQGKLQHGTVHIKVLGKGARDLHRKVLGWIAGFGELCDTITTHAGMA